MTKETLTMATIKSDLLKIISFQVSNKAEWRFSYIIPFTALAIFLGVFTKNVFIGIAVFCVTAYHILRFIIEYKDCKTKKAELLSELERIDISISTETLSHISNDFIYEPHKVGIRTKTRKKVTLFYFIGSSFWRVPLFKNLYEWSKEYCISSKGLENTSLKGDKFYLVSLQAHHDIAYIYPCKNFELDKSLEK